MIGRIVICENGKEYHASITEDHGITKALSHAISNRKNPSLELIKLAEIGMMAKTMRDFAAGGEGVLGKDRTSAQQ